jgi:hypothetical protein
VLLTEGNEMLLNASGQLLHGWPPIAYASPLSEQHGRAIFHGNVPGFPEMSFGKMRGSNVSTIFMDGHAESIDQDFAFDQSLWEPEGR